MNELKEALKEALERGDTQGAKDIILGADDVLRYGNVYPYYDKAFQLAAESGKTEFLKFLEPFVFDFNDDLEDETIWDESHERWAPAFEAACENGHGETAQYIIDNHEQWLDEDTPLLRMYQCGQQDYVDKYVKEYDDPKKIICMIIDTACQDGDLKAVKYFINTYKLTIKEYEGSLFKAIWHGHLPIVKHLIKNGIKIKQVHRTHEISSEFIRNRLEAQMENLKSDNEKKDIPHYLYKSRSELLTKIQNINEVHDYLLVKYPDIFM